MYGNEIRVLKEKALSYGIELTEHQLKLFQIYLDELWVWNQRINLTGLSSRERMVFELFLDSLIPAPFLGEEGRLLDVGSGAGFPGMPLKIYRPHLLTHLLEANTKKTSFLKRVVCLLGLDEIRVIKGRIERDGDTLHSDGYHLITARALARLGQTIAWCAPFLSPGGLLVSFLGRHAEDELKENRQIMKKHRFIVYKVIPYLLPGKRCERKAIILKKKVS